MYDDLKYFSFLLTFIACKVAWLAKGLFDHRRFVYTKKEFFTKPRIFQRHILFECKSWIRQYWQLWELISSFPFPILAFKTYLPLEILQINFRLAALLANFMPKWTFSNVCHENFVSQWKKEILSFSFNIIKQQDQIRGFCLTVYKLCFVLRELEQRQNKNDFIQSKIIPLLKFPPFSLTV